jgi:ADP-ribose pyrophosphatase
MASQRRLIYSGKVVELGIETLQFPDGASYALEIVRHPGGAAVVAIDAQGRLCLLRQYRHAAGGWLWELPAGKREAGEDPLHTAQRELEEEAGVRAAVWEPLGSAFMTPGFCDEVIHFYLARTLTEGTPRPESHEWLEHHWLPWDRALAWSHDGTLRDAKSLVGLHLAAPLLERFR